MKHSHKLILLPEEKYNSLQTTRKEEGHQLTINEEDSIEDTDDTCKLHAEVQYQLTKTLRKLDTKVFISAVSRPWKKKARSII